MRQPLRVTVVLTYYVPHWTGLTVNAQSIAEGLARRGDSVRVIASRHDASLPRRERIAGVDVARTGVLLRASRGVVSPGFVPAVIRALATTDVLHLHTPLPEAGALAVAARGRGVPVVVTHQGDVVMPAGIVNAAIARSVTASLHLAMRSARTVTTFTEDYARASRQLAPYLDKLEAIAPPVTIPEPDLAVAAAWRDELGLGGRPVVGFGGRFVEEKGFDVLLRAIPALVASHPDVALLYAGEAPRYERFVERCRPLLERHRDRVLMLGLIRDRARLAAFYSMCDVLAVPSRSDCFAVVQPEALMCGTPLVTSDLPGPREAVRWTGMGIVVAPENPAALAAGLARVLDDPAHFVRPRAEIEAFFGAEHVVERYAAVLAEAARC